MKRSDFSFILLILNVLVRGNAQKCCKSGQHLVEEDSRYICGNLSNVRLQDNFVDKGFFEKKVKGTCFEISEKNVAKFAVDESGNKIEKVYDYRDIYFPKCCPLDYRYNATTHGCERNTKIDLKILKNNSFVRVGLPECRMISDKILDSVQEVKMNGKDLVLLKERRILRKDYCVDSTLDGKLAVRTCEDDLQICNRIMCIHKCCPDGQSFIHGPHCQDTFVHGIDLRYLNMMCATDATEPFVLIHGFRPQLHTPRMYFVDRFGSFILHTDRKMNLKYVGASENVYCMEYVFLNKKMKERVVRMDGFYTFAQKVDPVIDNKFLVTRWVKIISCVFLILTISVYLLLPKMRNLFGKILLSYCVSTFTFFFVLAISQFYSTDFSDKVCSFVGFLSVLASIWSFTWLHIMCIDIWSSFGTPRTLSGPLQMKEWKRLLQYSLYGWGFPIIWVLMIALFNYTTMMPDAIHPIIGRRKCYIENSDEQPGNYSYLIYVTLPLFLQQIINTILFIKTILYCLKIKAEIERMNDCEKKTALNTSKERKPNTINMNQSEYYKSLIFHRLALIMKLAVIMGVLFLFETVSSVYNFRANRVTEDIEVIWDSINCFQGLYIFVIFICKKKVFYSICEKIPMLKSRKTSITSTATSNVSMHNVNVSRREKTPEETTCLT